MSSHGGRSGKKTAMKNNLETSKDLKTREEEYKRLNAELEAKTANLVREAEQVMKGQETILNKQLPLLDNINADDFLKECWEDDELNENYEKVRMESKNTNQSQGGAVRRSRKMKSQKSNINPEFSLSKTISNIEGKLDQVELCDEEENDDILPNQDLSSEAQIRFLKAKLRVMQEELDRVGTQYNKKDEETTKLLTRIKTIEDENQSLNRTNQIQQTQLEKYKKLSEDLKGKSDSLENQISALRKELDGMKRTQKQQSTNQSATEVRLNRALEEIEKYKSQLQKTKTSSKDTAEQDKRKMENLVAENKRLEKQKNELISGFKKQIKLIDILKRQKFHIESAKVLQFTEEEFMKALDWGDYAS
ncbi:testis-expressed protein 9-like [Tubulanus polymorphus]|uniref:testis-expressed protein 9-like n=1 Tax=Tubulanus polymorphus TaxID=672921 RepID=UPI003DA2C316